MSWNASAGSGVIRNVKLVCGVPPLVLALVGALTLAASVPARGSATGRLTATALKPSTGVVRTSPASKREVVITRSSLRLLGACTARALASFVGEFFDAFNAGDWKAADGLFAGGGSGSEDFKLFSWERDVIQERERLMSYLASLRDRGERFRLLSLKASREPRVGSSVAIEYVFEQASGRGAGKGLIECDSFKIWQWAMGPRPGEVALPCPQPRGWSPSGPVVACTAGPNARALAASFRVHSTPIALPEACRPAAARQRVRSALVAFNVGAGETFARSFVASSGFHPYTASFPGTGLIGRARIARFVSSRYRAGDGWTATRLLPPRGTVGLPKWAAYGLEFQLSHQGALVTTRASAKLVLDCQSGLLDGWVGPSLRLPTG